MAAACAAPADAPEADRPTTLTAEQLAEPDVWIWLGDSVYGDTDDMWVVRTKYAAIGMPGRSTCGRPRSSRQPPSRHILARSAPNPFLAAMSHDNLERLKAAFSDSYRIAGELGQGGMATVYLADDLKHERKVAVKVLRPELAALIGGERFLTEIKTTAALQHPHILPLFDSGEVDGFLYYVMPYVDGKSLRAHLDSERQLDVAEALKIAKAVASALGYAHDHDIIHRDIKPENILMHAGQPVVADFGIALAISAAGGGRLTETGLSLGTPHYMSPEQASADRELSARSDVYSLGCMLYEMLAGQPPHTGPTAQSILVRILTEEARPLTELRRTVPPHVAAVVTKAIEKLPADRFKSAQEFVDALDNEAFRWETVRKPKADTGAEATPATAAAADAARPWDTRSKVLAGLAGFFAIMAGAQMFSGPAAPATAVEDAPVVSFLLQDSAEATFQPHVGSDGTTAINRNGVIHVRPAGSLVEDVLEETSDVGFMTFSPDANWIAFVTSGQSPALRKVPTAGGPVVTLWTAEEVGQLLMLTWGEDGWIYGGTVAPGSLYRVPEVGGPHEVLLAAEDWGVFTPELIPGSRTLLVTVASNAAQGGRILALDLESGDTATVVTEGFTPRWVRTGHVLYGHTSGALFAVPFDPDRREATGAPVPVLDGLGIVAEALGRYDVSRSGTLAYVSAPAVAGGGDFALTMLDPNGGSRSLPLEPTEHWDAGFSPDGGRVAYIRDDDVWIYDLDLGANRAFTDDGTGHHNPNWSPDGTEIVFRASRDSASGVWVAPVDGSAEPRLLAEGPDYNPVQWLDDGTILISADRGDVGRVSATGGDFSWVFEADWVEASPSVSPDGDWIAYISAESGTNALYVRTWPELGNKALVSEGTSALVAFSTPVWAPDGSSLYYHQGQSVVEASLDTGDGFRVTGYRNLPAGSPAFYLSAIHPDGRLLLMTIGQVGDASEGLRAQLIVVTNWFTQLAERLGGAP